LASFRQLAAEQAGGGLPPHGHEVVRQVVVERRSPEERGEEDMKGAHHRPTCFTVTPVEPSSCQARASRRS
jgi:hypothetical protein